MTTTELSLSRLDIEHLPNFRRKTSKGEYSAACPSCGGRDRFLFWPDKGNYYCRRCELKGFVSDADNSQLFTTEQYDAWKRAKQERQRKERQQQQQEVIERLSKTNRADIYHNQMIDRSYWYSQGLSDETINKFKLGYCPACPTYPDSPSWTIPIFYQDKLYNIRHRLTNPNGAGKYRPETSGLPQAIFNADVLSSGDWMTVLVEGEVKAMVLQQYGFSTVGIPGANSFKDKWAKLFDPVSIVYIALDPGAEQQAMEIGLTLAGNGIETRVCTLPAKPDDMIVKYKATAADLFKFLILGKKVRA